MMIGFRSKSVTKVYDESCVSGLHLSMTINPIFLLCEVSSKPKALCEEQNTHYTIVSNSGSLTPRQGLHRRNGKSGE